MTTMREVLEGIYEWNSHIDRCNDLRARGVSESVIDMLKASRNKQMLTRVEGLSPGEIAELNAAA